MSEESSTSKLSIIALIGFAITCGILIFFYSKMETMQNSNEDLNDSLTLEKSRNQRLNEKNKNLSKDLEKKGIDLEQVKAELYEQGQKINSLQETKLGLQQEIAAKNQQVERLYQQMREISESRNADPEGLLKAMIDEIKADKERLLNDKKNLESDISQLEEDKSQLLNEKSELEKGMVDMRFSLDSLKDIVIVQDSILKQKDVFKDIYENTQIKFVEFTLTEEQTSKRLNNYKRKRKNERERKKWKYTNVTFFMSHPNDSLLMDKKFALQVIDKETNVPIENREDSPKHNYLIPFSFSREEKNLSQYNYQDKNSDEYEIQIVLIDNDETYRLINGILPIVSEGEIQYDD